MNFSACPGQPLDQRFVTGLLALLASTLPGGIDGDAAHAARVAFEALRPADARQAMLAAEIVAGHYAVMDCLRRAMQPETDAVQAMRLRGNAASLARMNHAAARALQACQAPPPQQQETAPKPAKPAHKPAVPTIAPQVQPGPPEPVLLDAEGKRIPLHCWEDMTMEQRRLAYGYPAALAAVPATTLSAAAT